MKCAQCQTENEAARRFCFQCGSPLPIKCPHCGFVNKPQDRFCGGCGRSLTPTTSKMPGPTPKLEDMHPQLQSLIPEALAQKYLSAQQQATTENRPITTLFADISGFTQLSATRSSEAIFQLVQDCFRQLVNLVANYEGSISGFRGDGLLALFGAPILHENDAERAILAALDMKNAMQQRQLEISIGINTALMTVGQIQTQLHQEYTAYGTDVNLAKRLQEAAKPGQILVGSGTYRLTRHAFEFEPISALNLKGFAQPVTAYAVRQVKVHPEKLRGIEGLRARMVGRKIEFSQLKEAVDQWLSGQGQMVSIIGEAGIGKSRLVSELKVYLNVGATGRSPLQCLEGRCVSIGQPISYWPFLDILRTYFGLSEEDDSATIARKVTAATVQLFSQSFTADESRKAKKTKETEFFSPHQSFTPPSSLEVLPFLGHLLAIKFDNELDEKLKFATPEQIKHQTLMRLKDFLETLAKKQPLLLILEDLHWSDDLSLDLIWLLMDSLATNQIMLLCVYRPEREHRVFQLSSLARRKCWERYTEITLNLLSRDESRQLVASILVIDELPKSVKEMILAKSEGNPFFIEEVIRSLIERDLLYQEDKRWRARTEIADIDVPDTIQSLILARVDRLQAEAKYVLQRASVIGRLFKYRLLAHLTQKDQDLEPCLAELEEKDLVYKERSVPELEYAFKHTLIQETTYQNILDQSRREFHQQVAVGIEQLYKERLEDYYEELAHHYSKSGHSAKAVEYLIKAGEKSKRVYANAAAMGHFKRALEWLKEEEIEGIKRVRGTKIKLKSWKLEALRGLGEVYLGIGKIVEAEKAFEQAITLATELKLPPTQVVKLYHWMSEAVGWQSRFDKMIHYGELGLKLLGANNICLEAALMNSRIAIGYYNKGNGEKYRQYIQKNMSFIKRLPYSVELRSPYEHIIRFVFFEDRDFKSALAWAKELERRSQKHSDLRGQASAQGLQGVILTNKGDHKSALSAFQKSLEIFERIGDKYAIFCHEHLGEIWFELGEIEAAAAHFQLVLKLAEQMESPRDVWRSHFLLGHVALCHGFWEPAISHFQRYLEGWQTIGNPFEIARAHLQLGKAYLKKGDYHKALEAFEEAANKALGFPETADRASWFFNALRGIEEACVASGRPEKFVSFVNTFKRSHADELKSLSQLQWLLQAAEPSKVFSHLTFADDFESEPMHPSWRWVDEFGDSSYKILSCLEIQAANGRDISMLNLSAPRLMREVSGNFALEMSLSKTLRASDEEPEKPMMGGILVWKDIDNYLRLEKGAHGPHEVCFHGNLDGKLQVAGRGLLLGVKAKDQNSKSKLQKAYLRLERSGTHFSAYCSLDEKNWLSCGKIEWTLNDPIQIGLHAIGTIDRTIYCGPFKNGTAIRFSKFKLWRHSDEKLQTR